MNSKKQIIKNLTKHKDQINQYGVKKIGVFGSFVKSEQKKHSDIDILVEFKPGRKSFDNYIGLRLYLHRLFKRKVDLVIKEALKPRIKPRILREVEYAGL